MLNAALRWDKSTMDDTGPVWEYVKGLYENAKKATKKAMYLKVLFNV